VEAEVQKETLARIASGVLVCLVTLTLFGTPVMAFDLGQWVPGLKVTPFLSEKVEYQSNVFQVPNNAQDDVIFRTIPGLLADYTFGSHSVSAGYRAEILKYVELTDQDTTNHFAAGLIRLDFPRTLLTLSEDFARTNSPPGTELTGPILSSTNTLKPAAEYRLTPSISLGVNYQWIHTTFVPQSIATLIDRDDQLAGASVFWKFVPKADVFLNYSYGWVTFASSSDGNRNYTSHNVAVGLRGDITAKLSSSFYIGYTIENPESSQQSAYSGMFMGGDFTYRPTERLTLTLSTQRARQESTFGTNAYYITTNATLAAHYQILPKLNLSARLGGGINDYSEKETADGRTAFRRDTFLLAGAHIEYDIQPWLRVGVEYERTSRDSNFPSFRFVDDHVAGRATVQF
jgi:hypothetical protein